MIDLNPFWDSVLATLGPALVGFLITRTKRFKAWRQQRKDDAEGLRAMVAAHPEQRAAMARQ